MKRNKESFKREYQCVWVENKSYQEAYRLWLEYFYRTELYDSKVCTGSNEYEQFMPASHIEYKKSNQHARKRMEIIVAKRDYLRYEGITIADSDWQSAKIDTSRYNLERLEREYINLIGKNEEEM